MYHISAGEHDRSLQRCLSKNCQHPPVQAMIRVSKTYSGHSVSQRFFLRELLCDLSDSAAFRGVFHRSSASVVLPDNTLAGTGSAFNPVHRLLT